MLEEDLELSKLAADDIESRLESRFEKLSPESEAGDFRIKIIELDNRKFLEFLNRDSNFGIQVHGNNARNDRLVTT